MKKIKQDISPDIQKIIEHLNQQIAAHKKAIVDLEYTVKMWLEHRPPETMPVKINSPLTRELVRKLLKGYGQPIQTVQAINILYKNIEEEERDKLVKTLSVIFNQMAKEDEITIEKRKGVKGNFYKLKK